MRKICSIAVALAALAASQPQAGAQDSAASASVAKAALEEENRRIVVTMYNLLMNDHKVDEALEYIGANYKQHNVRAPDGKEFLRGAFKERFEEYPKYRSDIQRTLADGDLVAVHTHEQYDADDPSSTSNAVIDIYRVDNGLIVEHWDAYISVPPREQWQNDNGMF
jgi:predicted SnoaL-like aldol condensation-catalyzing enzyme